MEVNIKGEAKEIAALVVALQERREAQEVVLDKQQLGSFDFAQSLIPGQSVKTASGAWETTSPNETHLA